MSAAPTVFDRRLLALRRQRAARAAGCNGDVGYLLDRVVDDLLLRLQVIRRRFADVVVVGAHDGRLGRRLRALDGVKSVVEYDGALECVEMCDGPAHLIDEENLALPPASADLIVSALSLQFVNDLPGLLARLGRALRPDGLLLVALAGGETLTELRQSLLLAESEIRGGASPRVAPFADVASLGALLQRARLALPVADTDRVTVTFPDALALMRDLRAMGATNVLSQGHGAPLTRSIVARAVAIYAERFPAENGRIRATFDIVTLTAWAPHEGQQKPLRPGSASARLADALGAKEHPVARDEDRG